MKAILRTPVNSRWLLVISLVVFTTRAVTAQCPAGSFSNAAGTYTNGQTVCISAAFSGNIQLNNGSTMVVISGGNFTGTLDAKQGSTIQISAGGTLAPNTANNFAGNLTNTGTVSFSNISFSNGASISNTACGVMTFSAGANVNSGAVITNNGTLNFSQDLNTSSGTTINNRGRVTVSGNLNSSGLFYNQNIAVFKGGNNNLNTGDSIVNLGKMTFSNSVNSSPGIRNDGLLTVGGSFTINGNTLLVNNSNAQLRVNGALSNNGTVQGNGSFYVAGAVTNNQTVKGNSGAQKLTVNQTISGGTTSNLTVNGALVAADTTTYSATMANPDVCSTLPVKLSSLQAVYQQSQVQLHWYAYAQSNARSFTIEYSQDGQTFTVAGELAATGDNNQTTLYQYLHTPNAVGTIFYRIRENVVDGSMYYTNMVAVKTGNTVATSYVFPNPFTNNLQITMQLEKAGMIQVALYDASGRLVKRLQQQGLTGRNTIVMSDLSVLLPGTYLVQMKAGDHTSFEKLIK